MNRRTLANRFATVGITAVVTVLCQLAFVRPARAQVLGSNDVIKYLAPPDTSTNGIDVLDTFNPPIDQKILADDFVCTQTGPITDITIWGSWLNDQVPGIPPLFDLSFESDVPNTNGTYSHPGNVLWDSLYSPTRVSLYSNNVNERFYDPDIPAIIGTDHQIWQYDFTITNAFYQTYGTTYWLNVQAQLPPGYTNGDYAFGWKTTPYKIAPDYSVYGDNTNFSGYPTNGWAPTGLSQAFELSTTVPEPGTFVLVGSSAVALLVLRRRRHARRG